MTIHILHAPGHNVVIKCHSSESQDVISTLKENGFQHGKVTPVDGIPQMVNINIMRDVYGSQIGHDELRDLFEIKEFNVAH